MVMEYYNGATLLNANCPISFSVGGRSIGKSFYWKRYCVRQFLKNRSQFIYIRRNQVDVDLAVKTWADDIIQQMPNVAIWHEHGAFYLRDEITGDVSLIGYAYSMSMLHKLKSMPLEQVNTIFYDEFIPDNLRYLKPNDPNYEPQLLLSLYMTVARGFDRPIRDEVKLICCANLVTMYNPYFSFFGIDLTNKKKQINNYVYAELVTMDSINTEIRKSKIGKILDACNYGAYALDNVPLQDVNSNIEAPPKTARVIFQLYLYKWYQCLHDDGCLYFREGYDRTFKENYKAVGLEAIEPVPWFKDDIFKMVLTYYKRDKIKYSKGAIKSALLGLFERK